MASFLSELGKNITDIPGLDASVIQSLLNTNDASASGTNGGIEYDDQGAPLLLRDSHLASNITTASNLWFTNVPRPKYLYYISFVSANTSTDTINTADALVDLSPLSYLVESIDRPTVIMNTKTLNQYNKKRIIHTGREYRPINCTFHDTANNTFFDAFQKYFNFFYGDSLNTASTAWANDTVAAAYNAGSNGWGYVIPQNSTASTAQFLDRIQIYEFYGGAFRMYELINPRFAEVRFDKLGYAETRDFSKVTVSIEYEGINFAGENQAVLGNTSLITEMGLSSASFYEPSKLAVNDVGMTFAPTASFNSTVKDTDYSAQTSESGLSTARTTNEQMSLVNGQSGLFSTSAIGTIGDFLTQNSGTLTQAFGSSSTLNSLTRGMSAISGGLF